MKSELKRLGGEVSPVTGKWDDFEIHNQKSEIVFSLASHTSHAELIALLGPEGVRKRPGHDETKEKTHFMKVWLC